MGFGEESVDKKLFGQERKKTIKNWRKGKKWKTS